MEENKNSPSEGTIEFKGSLTVREAARVKKELLDVFEKNDIMTIRFGEILEVDITFLQLLCASHKYAIKKNKKIIIDKLPPVMTETVRYAGFSKHFKCYNGKDLPCLWDE